MNTKMVKCPQCGKQTEFSPSNPHRPFCSDRCKLIDLGAWASEGYKIPVENTSQEGSNLEESDIDNDSSQPH